MFNPKTNCNSQKVLIKHTIRPDDLKRHGTWTSSKDIKYLDGLVSFITLGRSFIALYTTFKSLGRLQDSKSKHDATTLAKGFALAVVSTWTKIFSFLRFSKVYLKKIKLTIDRDPNLI